MYDEIIITPNPVYPAAKLSFLDKEYQAVVGREGAVGAANKLEGDKKTPRGSFKVLSIYYRPDRLPKITAHIKLHPIKPDDIWVDDVLSDLYNQPTKINEIKNTVSYERLFRDDHLYDVFLELDYNRNPSVKGKGSAILLHVARNEAKPQDKPTLGCIAIAKNDLLDIIKNIDKNTVVTVV